MPITNDVISSGGFFLYMLDFTPVTNDVISFCRIFLIYVRFYATN